jgi:chitinase
MNVSNNTIYLNNLSGFYYFVKTGCYNMSGQPLWKMAWVPDMSDLGLSH